MLDLGFELISRDLKTIFFHTQSKFIHQSHIILISCKLIQID
jgi:hypothetical protein